MVFAGNTTFSKEFFGFWKQGESDKNPVHANTCELLKGVLDIEWIFEKMDSKDKLKQWLNRSVRVKITDGRILIGKN